MKKIDQIIKVHKWKLDEKKTKLNNLKNLLNQFEAQKQKLDDDLERERKNLEGGTFTSDDFQAFVGLVNERKEAIDQSIDAVNEQIQEAELDMLEAFQDLKKYELIGENAKQKALKNIRKQEEKILDEVASQNRNKNKTPELV